MNAVIPSSIPTGLSEKWEALNELATEDLKTELARTLSFTADNLCRAAMIVSIIEARGEDLSHFKVGLLGYLRKIACGQVLPEVVARFVGHPTLKRIANLPIPDQERCLASDGVAIGMLIHGQQDTRMKPLLQMEAHEIRQVFASDHIRDPNEQVAWLRSREFESRNAESERPSQPSWTVSGRVIVVHRPTRLTRRDLENMNKALA